MRTLFVDFDGTICFDRFWRSLSTAEASVVQKVLFIENKELVTDWMRGNVTSEDVNRFVAKETSITYESLWYTFVKDCENMLVDQAILNELQSLRKKFHLVLITGNMDCFDRFTVPALNLTSYFDAIVNSFNEGKLKTDNEGETFKKYVMGSLNQAILIDDSEKSCAVFSGIGGTALQVSAENTTEKYLKELVAGKL